MQSNLIGPACYKESEMCFLLSVSLSLCKISRDVYITLSMYIAEHDHWSR